ncbi:MAG: diguanylate cyclase [Clostridiales bacterium]|nr:diguanylate cyclase [Clostridiales bacterium]
MLRLEWVARLFSIIAAVLLGILLSPYDTPLVFALLFWSGLLYALFLLFKKFIYPRSPGAPLNLIIEAIELFGILYIHWRSFSPLVAVLIVSFVVRMVLIYKKKIYMPGVILSAFLFILIDFFAPDSISYIPAIDRPGFWLVTFGFLIWFMVRLDKYIRDTGDSLNNLEKTLQIRETVIDELNESRDKLLKSNDQLYIWANTDPLTGLYNSRYFNRYWDNLYQQFSQLKQDDYPVALLMIDIQGHKIYNDVYGHAAGDLLIEDLAAIIRESSEAEDILVRYSDYVFAAIIPGQQDGEAIKFYHRFKQGVIEYSKVYPGMRNIEISVGWSSCTDVMKESKEDLIARAINNMRVI